MKKIVILMYLHRWRPPTPSCQILTDNQRCKLNFKELIFRKTIGIKDDKPKEIDIPDKNENSTNKVTCDEPPKEKEIEIEQVFILVNKYSN